MDMDPSRRNFLKTSVKAAIAAAVATKSSPPPSTTPILPKESMVSKFDSLHRGVQDADSLVKKVKNDPNSKLSKFKDTLDTIKKPLDTVGDNVKMTRRQFLQSTVTGPIRQSIADKIHQAGRTSRLLSKLPGVPASLSNFYKSSDQKKREKSSLVSRFGRFVGTESINSKVYTELQIILTK
jgi:hypothetical protein